MKKLLIISLLQLLLVGYHYNTNDQFGKWKIQKISVYICKNMKKIKLNKFKRAFKRWQKKLKSKVTFKVKRGEMPYFKKGISICFDHSWNRTGYDDAYALTTSTWSAHNREIHKSEIFFNAKTFKWTRSRSKKRFVNFESILMHEIGHAIGLRHSENKKSIMYARPHATKARKTLHREDIKKIKQLYKHD